jgi:hypothetical protein
MRHAMIIQTEAEELEGALQDSLLLLQAVAGKGQVSLVELASDAAYKIAFALPPDHPFSKRVLHLFERYESDCFVDPQPQAQAALDQVLHELAAHLG